MRKFYMLLQSIRTELLQNITALTYKQKLLEKQQASYPSPYTNQLTPEYIKPNLSQMQNFTNSSNASNRFIRFAGVIAIMMFAICSSLTGFSQTYFTEGFESEFTPNTATGPNAPAGWTQTRLGTLAGVPGTPGANGQRDWGRQVWSGTAWASNTLPNVNQIPYNSSTNGPAGAQAGTGAAWFNDGWAAGSGTSGQNLRRLESPVIDLSASTAPLVTFYQAYTAGSATLSLVASSDGGTTWNTLSTYSSIGSWTWTLRTVVLPAAYKVANAKIAFLVSNVWGSNDVFVDNVTVREAVLPDAPPTAFTATSVTGTGMTIGWTDNSTNETGFRLYRSTDNVTFTQVGTDITSTSSATTGTAYSSVQTGLNPGVTYYFRVAALLEAESAFLTGSQATTAAGNITSTATGGAWSATGTWTGGVVPTATDNVIIADGATVTIDVTTATCYNLTVGQGTSGILTWVGGATQATLTVNADLTVAANGTFNSGLGTGTKQLNIGGTSSTSSQSGNLTVEGVFDMSASSTIFVSTSFFGSLNGTISGAGATCDFNTITVNKGTSATSVLDVARVITQIVPASGTKLVITNGTFKLSTASTLTPYFGSQDICAATGRLWLNNAGASVQCVGTGTSATGAGSPTVRGILQIDNGTFGYGQGNNTLTFTSGSGVLNMSGGTLNMFGPISFPSSAGTQFIMSGGNINVDGQNIANITSATLFSIGSSTTVNWSGGTITIVDPHATAGNTAWSASSGGTKTITGGTLRIGDGTSTTTGGALANNSGFGITSSMPIWNLEINNRTDASTSRMARISGTTNILNSLDIKSNAYLFTGSTTSGNTLVLSGNTIINNGTLAGTEPGGTQNIGTIQFSGTSGTQTVSGSGAFVRNGTVLLTNAGAGVSFTQSGQFNLLNLTMRQGNITGASLLTIGLGGTTSSTVQFGQASGTIVAGSLDAAPTFDAGSGGFTLSYLQESAARTIGLEVPGTRTVSATTINNTNGVILSGGGLSTGTLALTAGNLTTSAANLITVTGTTTGSISGGSATSYVNGPLVRTLPANQSTSVTYVLPVGKTAFNAFELVNPTTTAAGTVGISAEVFDGNAGGTAGTLMGSISTTRYWAASIVSGAANFTNTNIRLNDTRGTQDGIAASATQSGSYDHIGGALSTLAAGSITSTAPAVTTLPGFFLMGNVAAASLSNLLITPATQQCVSTARTVTVTATPGGAAVTTVVINYSVNGAAQTPVSMTNTSGNDWSGVIPVVTPGNGAVTWSVTVTDANALSSTLSGTSYDDEPLTGSIVNVTATPAGAICAGVSVNLAASLFKAVPTTIGAGALTTSSSGTFSTNYVSPFTHYYGGYKAQYLITAAELASIAAGDITSLGFNITTAGTTYNGLTLSIGATSATALTGTFETTPLTQVYTGNLAVSATGILTIPFGTGAGSSTAFNWNGTSNILVQICWSNNNGGGTAAEVKYDATSFVAMNYYRVDSNTPTAVCGQASATGTLSNRPQIILGGNGAPAVTSISWSDGTNEVGTTSSITVTPSTTTSYTATITALGCTVSNTPATTITVNPLPAAPGTSPSSQCGTGTPSVFATGAPAGNYRWYLTPTGGSPLLGHVNDTLNNYPISIPTTFYVAINNGTCEGPRTAVLADVVSPDAITAVASLSSVCINSPSFDLSANQTGSNQVYTFTWSASPATGSGIESPATGSPVTVVPTAAGSYTYTVNAVDGPCATSSAVTVTVNPVPAITSVTASPDEICVGATTTLTAASVPAAAGTIALGTATTTTSTGGITPYNSVWEGSRTQYLVRASELTALGLVAGNLTSLGFDVTVAGTGEFAQSGFTVKIAGTAQTDLTGGYGTPAGSFTTVYGPVALPAPPVGVQTLTFTTPYNWDGTSNILIDICHDNDIDATCPSCYSDNAEVKYSVTAFNSVYGSYADDVQSCGTVASNVITTFTNRPNMVFGGQVGSNETSSLNWSWDNSAGTGSSVPVSPLSTTLYTVTAVNPTTLCSSTATVNVTVNDLPDAPIGTNSSQCGTGVPTASVTTGGANGNGTFIWYDAATGGTALQTSTATTYESSVSVATDFWVAEMGNNGCESPRTLVQVTFDLIPDELTLSASPSPACIGSEVTLTSTQTGGSNSYIFSYSASPSLGSGLSGTEFDPSIVVTPTVAGTFVYTITGFDPDKGCTNTASTTVIVNGLPPVPTVSATPGVICEGGSSVLTAAILGTPASGTIGTGTVTNTTSTPYKGFWGGQKVQMIYTAAELTTMGMTAGSNITSVGMNISAFTGPYTFNGFTIAMKNTSTAIPTTTLETGTTTVLAPSNYTLTGTAPFTVSHTLTTPFAWDGTSNLLVEYCFTNNNGGGSSSNSANVRSSTTTSARTVYYSADNSATVCSAPGTGTTTTTRPNLVLGYTPNATGLYTWAWDNGAGSGSTVTVTPAGNTDYTATATSIATGCSNVSAPVTVTVNPLPAAPGATPSAQCGTGIPTASVSGTGGTFKWYSASTGGTAIQTGGSTYAGSISVPTHFWVSETNTTTGCEGPRADVFADVLTAPTISLAATTPLSLCLGSDITLGVTSAESNYSYSWTASPGTGSGITGSLPGSALGTSSNTITPTAAGIYTYTVAASETVNGCSTTGSVEITVNDNPTAIVTAAQPVICAGGSTVLTASSKIYSTGTATVGDGATSTSSYNAPFYSAWSNKHMQILFTAAELSAAGLGAGNINTISFPTTSGTVANLDYSIKMGHTAATDVSAFVTTGLSTVYTAASQAQVANTNNTITLSSPFNWNGTSNLVVEICFGNSATTATLSSTSPADATSYVSVREEHNTSGTSGTTICGATGTSSNTYSVRPKILFGGTLEADVTGDMNWLWTPGGQTTSSITVSPVTNTSYTAQATNQVTGCTTISSAVSVTIEAVAATASATATSICVGGSTTLSVAATGGAPFTYSWSDGTTVVGTTASLSVSPVATTTYTVTVTDACSNPTTSSVTITVNANPTASVTVTGSAILCTPAPDAVTLTAVTDAGAATYQWKLGTVNLTGATNVTYTDVVASGAGSYSVVVTNTATGCSATSAAAAITSSARPTVTALATPAAVCEGSPLALTATGTLGAQTYSVAGITYAPTTDPGGTSVVTGDDATSTVQTIPFTFNYFGTAYTQLTVSSNGFIILGTSTSTAATGAAMPATATPNNVVAGIWSDLNVTGAAAVHAYTTGSAGSRIYTVHYSAVPFYSSTTTTTGLTDFYIQLFEGTNVVEVHIGEVTGNSTTSSNLVTGIENSTGTLAAAAPGRNFVPFNISSASPEAWRFTPDVITNYTWSGPNGFSATVQNPTITAIAAAGAGAYTVIGTQSNGCTGTASTAPVTVNPLPTITTAASAPGVVRLSTAQTTTLTYSATTESPTTYSITWNAAAITAGFVNDVNVSLAASPITINVPANVDAGTYTGTVTVANANSCSSNPGSTFTLTVTNANPTWTGNVSTDWNTGGNWSTGLVPAPTVNVTIDAPRPNYPVLTGNITVGGTLDLAPGATVTIGSNTLTVTGGITSNTGLLVGSNTSNLVLGASSSVRFAAGAGGTLKDFTVNGGTATLLTPLDITGGAGAVDNNNTNGVVTVATGAVIASDGNLTFKSNQYGSARLAQGSVTGDYITGDVTVERYIPASQRAWRMLSIPTKGLQTIKQAWQEGAATRTSNPKPGFGTQISSALSNAAAVGFDFRSASTSMQYFNPVSGAWVNITSTLNSGNAPKIESLKGYSIFIRGDRSVAATGTTTNATTLRTKGTLYTGDQAAITVEANKFDMIGNIFVSPIDFNSPALSRPGMVTSFYLWDPKVVNGTSLGRYVLFSQTTGWEPSPAGTSYGSTPNSVIGAGESFFVIGGPSGGTVSIGEGAKVAGNGVNMLRPASATQKLRANLYSVAGNTSTMVDANVSVFDAAYSNAVDINDAPKLSNAGENIAIRRDNRNLAVEGRQPVVEFDTTYFTMWNMTQQTQYKLELKAENMNIPGLNGYLVDNFTGTTTPLDMAGITNYDFSITTTASSAADRFKVVYRQIPFAPVPVTFVSINANKVGTAIKVDWKVAGERGIQKYEVERSADGTVFTSVGTVTATGNSGIDLSYNWTDVTPLSGTNFYRIKSVSVSGDVKFTNIVKVLTGFVKPAFTIAPNPVEGGIVNLQFKNQQPGKYNIRLLATTGEAIFTVVREHAGGTGTQVITLPATIARGTYQVEIISPDKTREVQNLFINTLK